MRRTTHVLLLLGGLAGAYLTRELRLISFAAHHDSQSYEDRYYLPPPAWLPVMSFGFHAALADLIWCRSLVYFGEEMLHKGAAKYAFEYTDAVLALDPSFRAAYMWINTVTLFRKVDDPFEDGLRASGYLKRAIQRWPNDGELHWRYGAMLRFELAPMLDEGPKKEHLVALSASHLAIAASLGAGPPWLALNSSALLSRVGKTEQAIQHLEEVYATVQDPMTKKEIERRLANLRSEAFVEALRTANADYERERQDSYPYLSPSQYLLVGPKLRDVWGRQLESRFLSPPAALDEPDEPATH